MPFHHKHPYTPFLFPETTKLIVGTLPPPRFTTGELRERDVDFCYGSRDGQLWPILDQLFQLDLLYENTEQAVAQREAFLRSRQLGICDIVESARRDKIDASDLGMNDVVLRDLITYLGFYPNINTLLFTGGNSKNGPEYFFRRLLKLYGLNLSEQIGEMPRVHQFTLPVKPERINDLGTISVEERILQNQTDGGSHKREQRTIKTISLIAPSGAANRAVGSLSTYKAMKKENPEFTTIDFRAIQYSKFF